jgi:hypothetical protein
MEFIEFIGVIFKSEYRIYNPFGSAVTRVSRQKERIVLWLANSPLFHRIEEGSPSPSVDRFRVWRLGLLARRSEAGSMVELGRRRVSSG